jgi:hypothetical protein
MEVEKIIKKIKEKYYLDFDTFFYNKEKNIGYYNLATGIVFESLFFNTLIERTKVGIAEYRVYPKLPLQFWDLFVKEINYYSSNGYYKEKLSELLLLCSFVSKYFYVDSFWKKENAELFEKLLNEEELQKLIKHYTGLELKNIVRETSEYYPNEVWAITKKYFSQ